MNALNRAYQRGTLNFRESEFRLLQRSDQGESRCVWPPSGSGTFWLPDRKRSDLMRTIRNQQRHQTVARHQRRIHQICQPTSWIYTTITKCERSNRPIHHQSLERTQRHGNLARTLPKDQPNQMSYSEAKQRPGQTLLHLPTTQIAPLALVYSSPSKKHAQLRQP